MLGDVPECISFLNGIVEPGFKLETLFPGFLCIGNTLVQETKPKEETMKQDYLGR